MLLFKVLKTTMITAEVDMIIPLTTTLTITAQTAVAMQEVMVVVVINYRHTVFTFPSEMFLHQSLQDQAHGQQQLQPHLLLFVAHCKNLV